MNPGNLIFYYYHDLILVPLSFGWVGETIYWHTFSFVICCSQGHKCSDCRVVFYNLFTWHFPEVFMHFLASFLTFFQSTCCYGTNRTLYFTTSIVGTTRVLCTIGYYSPVYSHVFYCLIWTKFKFPGIFSSCALW